MAYLQMTVIILIVLLSLIGGYFRLKIIASLKEGHRGSVWSGWWLFNPEWLDESGKQDRKGFIVVLLIELILLVVFFIVT